MNCPIRDVAGAGRWGGDTPGSLGHPNSLQRSPCCRVSCPARGLVSVPQPVPSVIRTGPGSPAQGSGRRRKPRNGECRRGLGDARRCRLESAVSERLSRYAWGVGWFQSAGGDARTSSVSGLERRAWGGRPYPWRPVSSLSAAATSSPETVWAAVHPRHRLSPDGAMTMGAGVVICGLS